MTGAALRRLLGRLVATSISGGAAVCTVTGCFGDYGGHVWAPKLHDPGFVPPAALARLPHGDWLRDPSACGRICGSFAEECRMAPNEGQMQPGEYLQCRVLYGELESGSGTVLPHDRCKTLCGGSAASSCQIFEGKAGRPPVIQCAEMPCVAGRRPAGLERRPARRPGARASVGDHFVEVAHLEAASVIAFEVLAGELRSAGAPERLTRAAARAARDEVRHARVTAALARRHGPVAKRPSVARVRSRGLEALARENAVEGCVLETWGALLAAWQAEASQDPAVRAAMRGIARDEARHAALAWSIASWAEPRLDPAARRRVVRARHAAARRLCAAPWAEPHEELVRVAGLPSGEARGRLQHGLAALLGGLAQLVKNTHAPPRTIARASRQ